MAVSHPPLAQRHRGEYPGHRGKLRRGRGQGHRLFRHGCDPPGGSREHYYTQLDRKFPGLKERTIRTYGSAYELRSAHHRELEALFHRLCAKHGIWHDNDKIFRWLSQLEEPDQLSFFHQEAI